jgi:signal transduction histidine kinase
MPFTSTPPPVPTPATAAAAEASIKLPVKYWLPLVAAVAISTAMFLVSETSYRAFSATRNDLGTGLTLQTRLLELEKTLVDAESSQRGYLVTRRADYLVPFSKAIERVRPLQEDLRDLVAVDREIRERFADVNAAIALKIAEMEKSILLAGGGSFESALAMLGSEEGQQLMQRIRSNMKSLNALVALRIQEQSEKWEQSVDAGRTGVLTVVAVNVVLIAITALLLIRDNRRAIEAMRFKATYTEQLKREVEVRTAELSSLSAYLQASTEEEKAALARELHDELGGILTPAKMDLSWLEGRLAADPESAERVRRLTKLIDEGIDMKRRIIENLRPSLIDHLGLRAALQWNVEETCKTSNLECHFRLDDSVERMSPDLEIALYRVVQESVTNTIKHAKATRLDLILERTAEGLHLVISDNGIGIGDPGAYQRMSHGLVGMRHRVQSVGGSIRIRGEPGKGTVIDVTVPLEASVTS